MSGKYQGASGRFTIVCTINESNRSQRQGLITLHTCMYVYVGGYFRFKNKKEHDGTVGIKSINLHLVSAKGAYFRCQRVVVFLDN